MSESTSLPLSPHSFAFLILILGLSALTALLYAALSLMRRDRPAPAWESLPTGWLAVFVPLALVWIALFLLTLGAVLSGTWRSIHDPSLATLGLGGLVVALLGAPFLIWGTVLKHQTVRWQKEGHMTDRISKAVEQLGAEKTVKEYHIADDGTPVPVERTTPNLEVRIGAILSLERIAQDSTTHDKGRDHVRVMEILCAYIRENAPADGAQNHPYGPWAPLPKNPTDEQRKAFWTRLRERFNAERRVDRRRVERDAIVFKWASERKPPRADIDLAINVIGRRSHAQLLIEAAWPNPRSEHTIWPFDRPYPDLPALSPDRALEPLEFKSYVDLCDDWVRHIVDPGYRLDLRGTNLQGAQLVGGNFQAARFDRSRLDGANFSGAKLQRATFAFAQMDGVSFVGAHMERAVLWGTQIESGFFEYARMQGANLSESSLNGSEFCGTRMQGAFLNDSQMEACLLLSTRLEGANMSRTSLAGAELSGVRFEGANFFDTQMNESHVKNVTFGEGEVFSSLIFLGATLRDIDLREVHFVDSYSPANVGRTSFDHSGYPNSKLSAALSTIFGDASVRLPKGMAPAHWPTWVLPDAPPVAVDWPFHPIAAATFQSELDRWRADPAGYTPPPAPA